MDTNKILIVDDEPLTCRLIAKILTLQGYTPLALTDGQRVLEVAEVERPRLILMDYHLGANHGLDVLQALKANRVSGHIPVIMTSGIDREHEALEAGAEAFLLKPFDRNELAAKFEQALSNGP
ncbi:MAG: PleD family two-component system response regulator [Anaerolineae bacterium]